MEKSKKISFTSIAIVVLAILLTVSLTMGGTLAWFANQNQAGTTLTMGNAVGVAVVDNKGNGSMDRLSFKFNTGRNGELMLPGTQIDPNVQALIAASNTPVILRAVVSFEVSLDPLLTDTERAAIGTATGQTPYSEAGEDGITRWFMTVPSSVLGALKSGDPGWNDTIGTADDQPNGNRTKLNRELYLLNNMYTSFFSTLQASALFNGWVYRESNQFGTQDAASGAKSTDSAKNASTKYYAAGYTQYQNTPIVAKYSRNAGPGRTQELDPTKTTGTTALGYTGPVTATHGEDGGKVSYNAFYFRGWATDSTDTTGALPAGKEAYVPGTGTGWQLENRGIDGIYAVKYDKGSRTGDEDYIEGTGRLYRYDRYKELTNLSQSAGDTEYVSSKGKEYNQYAVLEGVYDDEDNTITRYKDNLGYKPGDVTGEGENVGDSDPGTGILNIAGTINSDKATDPISGDKYYTGYNWATAGVTATGEDMMCVINTLDGMARIPLFTTSFILPTTWTQDAFADRSMKLNITFQVMQADYLASGVSHHCSVELAESRFDDVTIWPAAVGTSGTGNAYLPNQPYVKDVTSQPDFDNPDFWNSDDYYRNPVDPPVAG